MTEIGLQASGHDASASAPPPMRVLHVIPNLDTGGAQRALLTLARKFQRTESSVVVLGPHRASALDMTGVGRIQYLDWLGSRKDVAEQLRVVRALREEIARVAPHVVHSHLWPASRMAGFALWGSERPHLVYVQDTRPWVGGTTIRDSALRAYTRVALRGGRSTFVAVSEAAAQYHAGALRTARNIAVVPNGVDLDVFKRKPAHAEERVGDAKVILGIAARFDPEKGHNLLVRAAAQLVREGVDLEVHCAGTGELEQSCRMLAEELGIVERVRFFGAVEDVPSFLHTLDAFVLPSIFGEGLPLSVLEAMATGLPIVATRVAGTPEAVTNEVEGFLVKPNDLEALTNALRQLACDSELRRRMGQQARSTAEQRFSYDQIARRMEQQYASLIPML